MARRKSPIEKWLLAAMSQDEARTYIYRKYCRTKDGDIATTDGHRAHVLRESRNARELFTMDPMSDWVMPTQHCLDTPKNLREYSVQVTIAEMETYIDKKLNEIVYKRFAEREAEFNRALATYHEFKRGGARETLIEVLRETRDLLRSVDSQKIPIDLGPLVGSPDPILVNALYVREALVSTAGKLTLRCFGPLEMVRFDYDFGFAVVMPVRG